MIFVSLGGRPLLGLYYMMPFLPYRTMRDHFLDYPLGSNVTDHPGHCRHRRRSHPGKASSQIEALPGLAGHRQSTFISPCGSALPSEMPRRHSGSTDVNFVTWKDYMLIPLVFVAAGLVIEDRKAVRTVVLITAISLLFIDRSCLLESMSRTWSKLRRGQARRRPLSLWLKSDGSIGGPIRHVFLGFCSIRQTKEVQALQLWPRSDSHYLRPCTRSPVEPTSRALFSVFVLGLLKDRKLLLILGAFLPPGRPSCLPPSIQRVSMTQNSNGQLEASAQERVDLWENAWRSHYAQPDRWKWIRNLPTRRARRQSQGHPQLVRQGHGGNRHHRPHVPHWSCWSRFSLSDIASSAAPKTRSIKVWALASLLAMCSCLVANFFGDRWTYLEITGLLWVLIAAAARAIELI